MKYIHDTLDVRADAPAAVSIGKFDGFHIGHRYIVSVMKEEAARSELKTTIFTFGTSPAHFITGREERLLCTRDERRILAEGLGVDCYVEYPFTEQVRRMPAEAFLKEVLVDRLKVRHIVAGPDCRFGYRGEGDVECLQRLAPKLGFEYTIVPRKTFNGEVISSTRIRACLAEGQISEANGMLGYNFGVTGTVVRGKGIGGKEFGFPTVNQLVPESKSMPRSGVYLSRIRLEDGFHYGMSNIGRKPTIGEGLPVGVETHIFDYEEDLYGKDIRVEFLRFIRAEIRFDSRADLRSQMNKDRQAAQELIDECRKETKDDANQGIRKSGI